MADFCKQYSLDLFGEDGKDFADLLSKSDFEQGNVAVVLCEECGSTYVDHEGNCVGECLKAGEPGHGKKTEPK